MTAVCPTPKKTGRYATEAAAQLAARAVSEKEGVELSYYECVCAWWHLTRGAPDLKIDVAMANAQDIAYVQALPDIDFRGIVAQDARQEGQHGHRAALRHRTNQVRWRGQLGILINEIENDLNRRAGDTSLITYDWTRRATGYRDALVLRLTECKRLRAEVVAQQQSGAEARRRDAETAAAAGASVRDLREKAGEVAIQRLIEAHHPEFTAYLVQEYGALGITVPDRIERYRRHHTTTEQGK